MFPITGLNMSFQVIEFYSNIITVIFANQVEIMMNLPNVDDTYYKAYHLKS